MFTKTALRRTVLCLLLQSVLEHVNPSIQSWDAQMFTLIPFSVEIEPWMNVFEFVTFDRRQKMLHFACSRIDKNASSNP